MFLSFQINDTYRYYRKYEQKTIAPPYLVHRGLAPPSVSAMPGTQ
jgi:hypothetical protein